MKTVIRLLFLFMSYNQKPQLKPSSSSNNNVIVNHWWLSNLWILNCNQANVAPAVQAYSPFRLIPTSFPFYKNKVVQISQQFRYDINHKPSWNEKVILASSKSWSCEPIQVCMKLTWKQKTLFNQNLIPDQV